MLAWEVYAFSPTFAHQPVVVQVVSKVLPSSAKANTPTTLSPAMPPQALSTQDHWSNGDVVAALSSFYQTIIAILIALIGIMGVLAGFTLRALSRAAADETADEAVTKAMARLLKSSDFSEIVDTAVQETGIAKQLDQVNQDFIQIRRLILSRTNGEGTDKESAEGQVQPQAPGKEEI
jgi:hypothetical protein